METAVVPQAPGRLKEFTSTQRGRFAELVTMEGGVSKAIRRFYVENPEAHEYPYNTLLAYTKSRQFLEEDQPLALSGIREQLEEKPLVPRADRIYQLSDLFWGLKDDLVRIPLETGVLGLEQKISITAELRQLLKQIKEESQPFDSQIGVIVSPLEAFLQQIEVRDVTPEVTEPEDPGRVQELLVQSD